MTYFIPVLIISFSLTTIFFIMVKSLKESPEAEAKELAKQFQGKIDKCTRLKELNDLHGVINRTMSDFVYDASGGVCDYMDDIWRVLSNAIETKRKEIQNS